MGAEVIDQSPIRVQVVGHGTVEFPAGTSQAEMEAALRQLPPPPSAPKDEPKAPDRGMHPHARVWEGLKRILTDPSSLPTGGAMGGAALGAIGGPLGMIAGAGIGGMLGKGSEIMAREARGEGAPESVGAMAGDIATRGAMEAGAQAVGGVIGKGLQKAAKPVYNLGLRAKMSLRREHPNLAKTGIDEAITVSRGGTQRAEALRNASSANADQTIKAAQDAGAEPIRANDVIKLGGFGDDVGARARTRRAGGLSDDVPAVAKRTRTLRRRNQTGVPLTEAQAIKREAQKKADAVYRAAERGGAPPTIEAELDKATAKGFQKAIEQRVPNVRGINQRTRNLGGLTEALGDAGDRNQVLSQLLFPALSGITAGVGSGAATGDAGTGIAGGIGSAALMSGLTSPRALSRAAIGMDRAGKWGIPAQALRAAILAMMNDDKKDK